MINLRTRGKPHNIYNTVVARIEDIESNENQKSILAYIDGDYTSPVYISTTEIISSYPHFVVVSNVDNLDNLGIGDIVSIFPNGNINTIFRSGSQHNSLFITERCNSNCLMCSQPPKNKDDLDIFFDINSRLIELIPKETKHLGITGGEPLILGKRFITLLNKIKYYLPSTQIHVLTNGRAFAWTNVTAAINSIANPNVVFGVPLYSSYYQDHDFIVQAKDAFNQTIRGFHNMARHHLRLEIRIVLHKQTIQGLNSLSKFILYNFPFVEHVAFMGLEYVGYTPYNDEILWVEPMNYQGELEDSVLYLDSMGIPISIYNIPLCLLKKSLWKFSRKSISDWKREYLDECNTCIKSECGGVFATSKKQSNEIKAFHN